MGRMMRAMREADLGEWLYNAVARIFPLLILLQGPIMLYFMVLWLPHFPRQAVPVLALQLGAIAFAVMLIMILEA